MARNLITVRLSDAGLTALDELAADTNTNRSAALRALLSSALASAPVVQAARARLKVVAE